MNPNRVLSGRCAFVSASDRIYAAIREPLAGVGVPPITVRRPRMSSKIKKLRSVDFNLLETVRAPQAFTQIEPTLFSRIQQLPEVLERVEGCVHFCFLTNQNSVVTQSDYVGSARPRQMFLRAALCEFGSIGDAAKLDFEAGRRQAPAMDQLLHPQIHIIRLLRHVNVHLAGSPLGRESRPAIWNGPNGVVEFEHVHYVVKSLAESVRETDDARKYADGDLTRMTNWLEDEQCKWGIANVIHRTAETYAAFLADRWERS